MRLNKYIARCLGVSRRKADGLIASGRIKVNGQSPELGMQVSDSDVVTHQGQEIAPMPLTYVLLNKPVGYVCSRRQQGEHPTIYQLLPNEMHHLQVAGRLDQDSSGLLLLTNDGEYAHLLTHPRYEKEKQYLVKLDKMLQKKHQQQIESGVELEDGVSSFQLQKHGDAWQITMREGRNRQIRRTFEALGYQVTALHRTKLGNYSIENIEAGEVKTVSRL